MGVESWSFVLKENQRLKVYGNEVVGEYLGRKEMKREIEKIT
jgi:hypothetical protein